MVLAAGAGLAFPPLSPAMRAAWRTVLPHTPDRQAAFALDAVAVETVFIGGPLLLSLLLVVAPPAVPLLATAGLLAGGGTAYSLTGAARRWRAEPHAAGTGRRGRSPLSVPGVLAVLVAAAVMSVGFGHTDVSIAATARDALGAESRLGLLFAAIAGGSVVGGLLYGARTWRRPERERLPVTLAGFAAGLATLPLVVHGATTRLGLLLPLLFVTGLFIAPSLIVQQSLVDEMSPQDRLGEAQAWLGTAITAGAAAGTAVAGVLVDLGGPGRSFLGAASAVALAAVVAVVARPPGPE
jgi:predicted MFS family arabinose efflux permease